MNRSAKWSLAAVDWPFVMMGALGLWLSGSVLVDCVIMPSLSAGGMMTQPGFLSVGYGFFSIFNHLEMVLAGIVVSGCWCLQRQGFFVGSLQRWSGMVALGLLAIALIYTYGLTPALSDLGFEMAQFNGTGEMPAGMMPLHWLYWGLELVKLALGVTLGQWCYRGIPHWHPTAVD